PLRDPDPHAEEDRGDRRRADEEHRWPHRLGDGGGNRLVIERVAEAEANGLPQVVNELLGERQVEPELALQVGERSGRHVASLLRQELRGVAESPEEEEVEGQHEQERQDRLKDLDDEMPTNAA